MINNNYHNIKSSYYETTTEEFTLLNYQCAQMELYLNHFFFQKGIILQKTLFQINYKYLNVILYFSFLDNVQGFLKKRFSKKDYRLKRVVSKPRLSKKVNNTNKIQTLKLSEFLRQSKIKDKRKFLNAFTEPTIIQKYKRFKNKLYFKTNSILKKFFFYENILETLSNYTKNRFHISVIFKNINRSINMRINKKEKTFLKEQVISLKSYTKQIYFKDSINLFVIAAKAKHSSSIFSKFIVEHLKYLKHHKPFLSYISRLLRLIIYCKKFVIKGIKIRINGRLNNKSRSSSFLLIIGNIPTITKNAETIDYSENTCFTKNGTLGVKVWCNY